MSFRDVGIALLMIRIQLSLCQYALAPPQQLLSCAHDADDSICKFPSHSDQHVYKHRTIECSSNEDMKRCMTFYEMRVIA
jgi:hypothetical protein